MLLYFTYPCATKVLTKAAVLKNVAGKFMSAETKHQPQSTLRLKSLSNELAIIIL